MERAAPRLQLLKVAGLRGPTAPRPWRGRPGEGGRAPAGWSPQRALTAAAPGVLRGSGAAGRGCTALLWARRVASPHPGTRERRRAVAASLAPGDRAAASPWEATGWRPSVRRPRRGRAPGEDARAAAAESDCGLRILLLAQHPHLHSGLSRHLFSCAVYKCLLRWGGWTSVQMTD